MPEVKYGNLSFDEAIKYFQDKGIEISPNSWKDLWQQASIRGFTVSRVTAMDVLSDIHTAVDDAVSSGQSLGDFKKGIRDILEKKGWYAPKGENAELEMPDGTIRKRLTGWRLDTIYNTNLQTAYSAGRYKQMMETKSREYWQYKAIMDSATRPDHAAMNDRVWHRDHPIWNTWYPPNGFNCRCYVKTLSERQMQERGLWEQKEGMDEQPDEGFRYNVGRTGIDNWQPDLNKYPKTLADQFKQEKPVFD